MPEVRASVRDLPEDVRSAPEAMPEMPREAATPCRLGRRHDLQGERVLRDGLPVPIL